ncbi:MAG: hypothetical protein ACR2PL_28335 [Dehalococcoidia bacterium]
MLGLATEDVSPREALRRVRSLIASQNGVIAPLPISEEELNPEIQDDLSLRVTAIEPIGTIRRVPFQFPEESDCSEFSFFEDGKQRTVQVGYIPTQIGTRQVLIPVHFYVVAAVILRRDLRELKLWTGPILDSGILVARSLVPDQSILEGFEESGLRVVDTRGVGGDYYDLRRRALNEAKTRRLLAEDQLIAQWRVSPESSTAFLVVDGTLMNLRNEASVERCIGISKSFGSRYFDVSDHSRILNMGQFARSWTFRFHSPEDEGDSSRLGARDRISWYPRLRTRPNTDPEFGLVRVEVSQRHAERATEYADRFSRSLLSDRLPTSYPAPRWDNHLYPIAACENYLSSVMPSIETINAAMRG